MKQTVRMIFQKLLNLIKIGKVVSVDDSSDLRQGIISFLGKQQKVCIFTPYGIMHNPPKNSLSTLFCVQGQESNMFSFSDDPKNRPLKNLKEGEFAIGNYKTGDYIYFDEEGNLKGIVSKDLIFDFGGGINLTFGDVNITAENINITANDVALTLNSFTINGKDVSELHTHPILDGSSAPGPTGGVT